MKPLSPRLAGATVACCCVIGCATSNPPMVFGDSTTFGIQIGNQTSSAGASVSLGIKAQSLALVPATYNDDDGAARTLKAQSADSGSYDSMSVFASFASATPPEGAASAAVGLGQLFSTGLAAQLITAGYVCRAKGGCGNVVPSDAVLMAAAQAASAATFDAQAAARSARTAATDVAAAIDKGSVAVVKKEPPKKYDPDAGPYQRPLVFLRSDVFGFDIGGSLAERGLQFALGFSSRNLALVPVHAIGQDGNAGRVSSGIGGGELGDKNPNAPRDALSVLGQFRASTQTASLGYELERFFATGVAARNLAQAIGIIVARSPLPGASAATK